MVATSDAEARGARLGVGDDGAPAAGHARLAEIQRARLVSAMVEVAGEHGFAGATVSRVVERAGVSRRTFYELFEDREACFLAGFEEAVTRASHHVLARYDPDAAWSERLRMALAGLLSFLEAEPSMGRLLVVSSLGAGSRAIERRERVLARALELVDEGRQGVKPGSQPPPLAAEGVVGGVLAVLHARMLVGASAAGRDPGAEPAAERGAGSLLGLLNQLASMIVLPYRGQAAARKELTRPLPSWPARPGRAGEDPLRHLDMRLTYRTVCVLAAIAERPGSSNREIGRSAGIGDQGQTSKLLGRLERLGLACKRRVEPGRGGPNAWELTARGVQIEQIMRADARR